jgi:hypothetical protein
MPFRQTSASESISFLSDRPLIVAEVTGPCRSPHRAKGRFWLLFLRIGKLGFASGDHSREKPDLANLYCLQDWLCIANATKIHKRIGPKEHCITEMTRHFETGRNGNVACHGLIRFWWKAYQSRAEWRRLIGSVTAVSPCAKVRQRMRRVYR